MEYKKDINLDQNPHPAFTQDTRQMEERKGFHLSLSQRTEKLATAIFMVTNHIDDREMIRSAFRDASLSLVLDTAALEDPMQAPEEIFQSLSVVLQKLQSLTNITSSIGLLSRGNGDILASELAVVREQCAAGHKFYALATLDDVLKTIYPEEVLENLNSGTKQEIPVLPQVSDRKEKLSVPSASVIKHNEKKETPVRLHTPVASGSSRKDQILKLIKDKGEVSIKDISNDFADCSEKTIQRDINALVEEGKLAKSGDRRWSRYAIKK